MTASGAMQLKHSPVHPRIIDNISERIVTVPDPSGSSMIIDILEHIAAEAPQVRERHQRCLRARIVVIIYDRIAAEAPTRFIQVDDILDSSALQRKHLPGLSVIILECIATEPSSSRFINDVFERIATEASTRFVNDIFEHIATEASTRFVNNIFERIATEVFTRFVNDIFERIATEASTSFVNDIFERIATEVFTRFVNDIFERIATDRECHGFTNPYGLT
jgi:hypothetical protein